jgi:hypothetical protein
MVREREALFHDHTPYHPPHEEAGQGMSRRASRPAVS